MSPFSSVSLLLSIIVLCGLALCINADPMFVGFRGQNYEVSGTDGYIYSVISDARVQINSRFKFLSEGQCPADVQIDLHSKKSNTPLPSAATLPSVASRFHSSARHMHTTSTAIVSSLRNTPVTSLETKETPMDVPGSTVTSLSALSTAQMEELVSISCWSKPGTYFSSLSIQTLQGDCIYIEAGPAATSFKTVQISLTPSVCHDQVQRNNAENDEMFRTLSVGESWTSDLTPLPISTDRRPGAATRVEYAGDYTLRVRVGVYSLVIQNSDQFVTIADLSVSSWQDLVTVLQPHGLLGQTWRRVAPAAKPRAAIAQPSAVLAVDAPMSSSVVVGVHKHEGITVLTSDPSSATIPATFIEGELKDYVISENDMMGRDFKFSKFHHWTAPVPTIAAPQDAADAAAAGAAAPTPAALSRSALFPRRTGLMRGSAGTRDSQLH